MKGIKMYNTYTIIFLLLLLLFLNKKQPRLFYYMIKGYAFKILCES